MVDGMVKGAVQPRRYRYVGVNHFGPHLYTIKLTVAAAGIEKTLTINRFVELETVPSTL